MPKLLQINVTANWGSTGKIAETIGNAAISRGWDSYLAYGRWANPSTSKLIKVGLRLDTYIHFAFDRLLDKEGRSSVRATKELVKQIADIKPDVVQLHNIHDHYLNYQILFEYLNQTDIKVVWTFHDCWAFTGHCYHFVQVDCMKWKTKCENCVQRHKFVDRSTENFLLKKSLFSACKNLSVVACSEWMGNFVKESFLKDKPLHVIHNGIDLNIFKPLPEARIRDGKFRLIAVSNVWTRSKGLYDLFKLRDLLSDDYEIRIVGLSPDQISKLSDGIRGIQRTQDIQELVRLYNEADVLVNPTYADTFPTVNLEALACGTPVITYRTGGSPEAVDARTGVVVDRGDVVSLAEAIKELYANPLLREDCRARAETYFNEETCFSKYIELYNSLI